MSATFLIEIGVEELPASFVDSALGAMPGLLGDALTAARIEHRPPRALGTPRRLALLTEGLAERQADLSETIVGPPKAAAFEVDGTPKKAAIGFAKKLGIPVEALTVEETDKGPYLAGRREERGRTSAEVLPEIVARTFSKIPFPKSMRWGLGEVSFGRPVHWVVCLLGDAIVGVELAGVTSGRTSRGHRFLSPAPIDLPSADGYVDALREAHVLVDPAERTRVMVERLDAAAASGGGVKVDDPFLVAENAGMVEEPHVICGSFDAAFLELPDEVTVGVMRGHQRYFALRDQAGKLLPRYLAVVNTSRAPEVVTKGNDRVLRARLADGRFFVEEDLSRGLEDMVPALDQVVYQAKLGSVGERALRLQHVVRALGDEGPAIEAARLCKADLVSLIVGEFPELQGRMGRYYAERAGVDALVAGAIEEHYLPRHANDVMPSTIHAARLAVAERADALVGCFGIGLIPTGSNDPFALRRATLGMIHIALRGPMDVDVRATLAAARDAYVEQGKALGDQDALLETLLSFFRGRLESGLLAEGHAHDGVEAGLGAWRGDSIRDARARVELATEVATPEWATFREAFKRAYNIAKDAPEGAVDAKRLTENAERMLAERWTSIASRVEVLTEARAYRDVLPLVADLRDPIHRFFEEVFVMVDDAAVRDNRLRLLASIARALTGIAHFHLLSA